MFLSKAALSILSILCILALANASGVCSGKGYCSLNNGVLKCWNYTRLPIVVGMNVSQGSSSLILDENCITQVPDYAFRVMHNVRNISLRNNAITSIDHYAFSENLELRIIDLSYNALSQLPDYLLNSNGNLTSLDLRNNQLSGLHSSIFMKNAKLKQVDLSYNALSQLPGNLFISNGNLTSLNLGNNNLTTIQPSLFKDLASLEIIDLRNNQLSGLPSSIFMRNAKLKQVHLGGNPFIKKKKLPKVIEELRKRNVHVILDEDNVLSTPQPEQMKCYTCNEPNYKTKSPIPEKPKLLQLSDVTSDIYKIIFNNSKKGIYLYNVSILDSRPGLQIYTYGNHHLTIVFKQKYIFKKMILHCQPILKETNRTSPPPPESTDMDYAELVVKDLSTGVEQGAREINLNSCREDGNISREFDFEGDHVTLTLFLTDPTAIQLKLWMTAVHVKRPKRSVPSQKVTDQACPYIITCTVPGARCGTHVRIIDHIWFLQKGCCSERNTVLCNPWIRDACQYYCTEPLCNAITPMNDFTILHYYDVNFLTEGPFRDNLTDSTSTAFEKANRWFAKEIPDNLQVGGMGIAEASLKTVKPDPTAVFGVQVVWRLPKRTPKMNVTDALSYRLETFKGTNVDDDKQYTISLFQVYEKSGCAKEYESSSKGMLTWPESNNKMVFVPCPGDRNEFASRRCYSNDTYGDFWGPTNMTSCPPPSQLSKNLQNIAERVITTDNLISITSELTRLTGHYKDYSGSELSLAVKTTDNIVNYLIAQNEIIDKAVDNMATTYSSLLKIDGETLRNEAKDASGHMLNSMDSFVKVLRMKNYINKPIVRDNLAINIMNVKPNSRQDLTIDIESSSSNNTLQIKTGVSKDELGSGSMAFVQVPINGTKMIKHAKTIDFRILSNADYFIQSSPRNASFVNSYVIMSRLDQGHVFKMTRPIVFQLKLLASKNSSQVVNCAFWNTTSLMWSREGCWLENYKEETMTATCACDHMTNFALLMDIYDVGANIPKEFSFAFQVITNLGCTLSLIGLLLTILTYASFQQIRKEPPGKILLCLSITMFMAYLVFLVGSSYSADDARCKVIAIMMHYLFLSVFCWNAIEAFYLYLSCVKVLGIYISRLMLKASLAAWGIPLIVVIITISVNVDNYGYKNLCWLQYIPFLSAFVVPVTLIMLTNLIIFAMVIHQLRMRKAATGPTHSAAAKTRFSVLTQIRGAVGLWIILGLTWLFAAFAIDGGAAIAFQILFALFNSCQGLFVFIFHCVFKRDVQQFWYKHISCLVVKPSTSVITSSTGDNSNARKKRLADEPQVYLVRGQKRTQSNMNVTDGRIQIVLYWS